MATENTISQKGQANINCVIPGPTVSSVDRFDITLILSDIPLSLITCRAHLAIGLKACQMRDKWLINNWNNQNYFQ